MTSIDGLCVDGLGVDGRCSTGAEVPARDAPLVQSIQAAPKGLPSYTACQ